jgi:hypothetical protein
MGIKRRIDDREVRRRWNDANRQLGTNDLAVRLMNMNDPIAMYDAEFSHLVVTLTNMITSSTLLSLISYAPLVYWLSLISYDNMIIGPITRRCR